MLVRAALQEEPPEPPAAAEGSDQQASQVKELSKETVATLKEMCKSKGVAVSGTKMQLISRIVNAGLTLGEALLVDD